MENLRTLSETELRTALEEWKRWLDRVCHASDMSGRQERFEEARAHIAAIEREISLRSTPGCERLFQEAGDTLRRIASDKVVVLAQYRAAHQELQHVNERLVRRRGKANAHTQEV